MAGKEYTAGYNAGRQQGRLEGQDIGFKEGYNYATEAWKKRNKELQLRIGQLTDDAGDMIRHLICYQYGSEYNSFENVKHLIEQSCPKQAKDFDFPYFFGNLKWPERLESVNLRLDDLDFEDDHEPDH